MRLVHFMKQAVRHTAQTPHLSLHTATFIVACTRILSACDLRGLYPLN